MPNVVLRVRFSSESDAQWPFGDDPEHPLCVPDPVRFPRGLPEARVVSAGTSLGMLFVRFLALSVQKVV